MAIEVKLPADSDFVSYNKLEGANGYCNWEVQQTSFDHVVHFVPESSAANEIKFRIRFKADQDFAHQDQPDPNVTPQTYVNKLRLEDNYVFEKNGKLSNVPVIYSIKLTETSVDFYEVHFE